MLTASTEEDTVGRRDSYPYTIDQQGHTNQFSTTYHLPTNGNVPLFKSSPLDKEEQEDYDYGPTDLPETYPQSLHVPTQPSSSSKVISVIRDSDRPERVSPFQSFDRGSKLELVERYGVHDHAAEEEGTETTQSTGRPHMHEDTTTAWQHSQSQTSVQNVSFEDKGPSTHIENPSHTHTSLDSTILPLNQGLEKGEKHSKYPHMISEGVVRNSVTMAHHQEESDSVRPTGSNSQINVSHQVGAESQSDQQSQSESSHKGLQYTVPGSEEELEENNMEEEQEEEIVTFQSITESEGKDVPYKIKSAQQEISGKDSESSDLNSSYQKTTAEPSTTSPRKVEYHTTPMVPFIATATTMITTTTTQLPVKVKLDESQFNRKPGQRLFNLHGKDRQDVEEDVMEEEEERKHRPVLLIKPDGGKWKDAQFKSSFHIIHMQVCFMFEVKITVFYSV